MLQLPASLEDIVGLADWLEIKALQSPDGNASQVDLEKNLRIALPKDRVSEIVPEVFLEIERRASSASGAYPFFFETSTLLKRRKQIKKYAAYLFCLALSYFGWNQKKGEKLNPRHLFEELCCLVAENYLDGEVVSIGTGKRQAGQNFYSVLTTLIDRIGEGKNVVRRKGLSPQDDHVDLVGWRHFPDKRENKLVLFGNCASGDDWADKLTETAPDSFWDFWIDGPKVSAFVKSVFIPHRVYEEERWIYFANRSASVLFDRCRIAYYLIPARKVFLKDNRFADWASSRLKIVN